MRHYRGVNAAPHSATVPDALFDDPDAEARWRARFTAPWMSRPQWVRIAFIGILTAIMTIYLESIYQSVDLAVAATVGYVAICLLSVAMALSARSETGSAFNRDIFEDRNQLLLYGIAIAVTILGTEFGPFQRLLGTVSLTGEQWLICIGAAIILLLVEEVIKFFLRRRVKSREEVKAQAPQPA